MVPSWEWEDLSILSLGQDLSILSLGQDLSILSLGQDQFLSSLSMVLSYLSMVTMVLSYLSMVTMVISYLSMVTMVVCGEVTRQQDHQDGGAKDQGPIYRLASRIIQQDKNYGRYYTSWQDKFANIC